MVSNRQRRRALARAKWQRQQARRTAAQRRARVLGIIGGTAVAVVTTILVGWGVVLLIQDGNSSPSQPVNTDQIPTFLQPSDSGGLTITQFSPPTSNGTSTGQSTKSGSTTSRAPTSPTSTATTGTGH